MTDQDQVLLLQDFRAGDPAAFEKVFRLYYKPLHMQAFLLLKDSDEAEDQVQQLFTDIWNRQAYTKVRHSVKAWLHAALRNRCLNCLIRNNVHTRLREEYAGHAAAIAQPDHRADPEPAASPLLGLLAELPTQRYKAFSLVHLHDKKYHEAAKEMGISVNSLKTHVKLAVRFLRTRLG